MDAASSPEPPDDAAPRGAKARRGRALDDRQLRAVGLTVLAAALLTVLTIVAFNHLPRYDLPGEPFMDNADFRHGFEGWEIGGIVTLDEVELGLATLQSNNPDDIVYLRREIELPEGRTSVQLSADVESSQVQQGELPWQTARIYLVQQAADGTLLWSQRHMLVELVGTAARHHVSEVFEIPAAIERVVLGIELPFATGQFSIANLRLALLDELPTFRLVATLLVAGWCVLGVWAVWRVLGGIAVPKVRVLVLLTLALMLGAMFMPATLRQHLIDSLATGFVGVSFTDPDRLGHAVVFVLLALFVRVGRRRDPLLLHLSCWLMVGAATEVLQLLTADRAPEAADWLADAFGAAIGLMLAEIGLKLERLLAPAKKRRADPRGWSERGLMEEAGRRGR